MQLQDWDFLKTYMIRVPYPAPCLGKRGHFNQPIEKIQYLIILIQSFYSTLQKFL